MFVVHFSSVCYKALLEVVKLFNHKKAGVTRINKTQNNPIGRRDEKFCKKIWGYHQFTTTTAFPTTFPAESQPQQKPCVLALSDGNNSFGNVDGNDRCSFREVFQKS